MCTGNESEVGGGATKTGISALRVAERRAKLLFVFIRKGINEQSYCINEPITG